MLGDFNARVGDADDVLHRYVSTCVCTPNVRTFISTLSSYLVDSDFVHQALYRLTTS